MLDGTMEVYYPYFDDMYTAAGASGAAATGPHPPVFGDDDGGEGASMQTAMPQQYDDLWRTISMNWANDVGASGDFGDIDFDGNFGDQL